MTHISDRFGFVPRNAQRTKTPILAEVPSGSVDLGVAKLRLYDPIDSEGGYWGVSANEFAAVLDGLDSSVHTIELHVNSPGGSAFDGIAILNVLRQHRATFNAVVDGLAASAASFIAAGAKKLTMMPNSQMMIHDGFALCIGPAAVMYQCGDMLNKVSDNIASVYAMKSGTETKQWRDLMLAETWMTADEAVSLGLADEVAQLDDGSDAAPENAFDLSVFKHAGRDEAPAPEPPVRDEHAARARYLKLRETA